MFLNIVSPDLKKNVYILKIISLKKEKMNGNFGKSMRFTYLLLYGESLR